MKQYIVINADNSISVTSLREHALSFNEQLATFEYIYSLTEEGDTPVYDDDEDRDDEDRYDEEDIEEA